MNNYVNLVHGINNTRVYKIEKEFFTYTVTTEQILTFSSKKINEIVDVIMDRISDENAEINLMFAYKAGSLSRNKKKNLKILLAQGLVDVDRKNISSWISLLI